MMFKKFIIGLAIFSFMSTNFALAQQNQDYQIKNLINKYKGQNYLGCIDTSNKIIEQNPSNIFAYYYKGLAYIQLGKKEEATQALEQVINLNSNATLVEYATKATACINNPDDCSKYGKEADALDAFIKSGKFYDNSVQAEVNKKKLDRIRQNINDELNNNKKGEMPTNDEIANAVKTLAKLGINPLSGMNNYANPQMMELGMLLGNNNNYYNNNSMNMLPMLLMNQNNNQQMSPELIQTMMMSQMPAL